MAGAKKAKRIVVFLVCIAVALSAVLIRSPKISAATIANITGEGVKLRSAPTTKGSTVITKLSLCAVIVNEAVEGEEAEAGQGTRWYNVTYNNYTGYVYGAYVMVIEPPSSAYDENFEKNILNFPESYREQLRTLHNMYPNWTFEAHNLNISFDEALKKEDVFPKKLVPEEYSKSLRSMGAGAYDWSTGKWKNNAGSWVGASTEVIAYHLDPRNFLNFNHVYMFARLTYDADSETAEGLKKIVSGTFLDTDEYINIMLTVARETGVSAYMIASTIKQEQGVNGSSTSSGTYPGYEGYYNFFNVKASGATEQDVIINGLKHAKSQGWTSPYLSIKGGAELLGSKYFKYGQNTYYYKNFDVISGNCDFQYAQNIYDSKSSCASLRKVYIADTESRLHFIIPVYRNMWASPAPAAPENDGVNNYYFLSLGVPGFSMYTEEYSLSIGGDTTIGYSLPANATYVGEPSYSLSEGSNTVRLEIKAESGSTNTYTLNITASQACTLKIEGGSAAAATVKRGDTNGDGKITIVDLARVQKHLLKVSTLSGADELAADTNGDGSVTIVDLARIQKHLLKLITIS